MFSHEVNTFLASLASLAAIGGAIIYIYRVIIKKIRDYKETTDLLEEKYEQVKIEINLITKQAATQSKLQDLYFYASSQLNQSRHIEIRFRFFAAAALNYSLNLCILATLFVIPLNVVFFLYTERPLFHIAIDIPTFLNVALLFMWGSRYYMHNITKREFKRLSNLNDSYSEGFIEAMNDHIKKILPEIEKPSKEN